MSKPKRDAVLKVKLRKEEYDWIKEEAKYRNQTISDFVRLAIISSLEETNQFAAEMFDWMVQ